MSKSSERHRAWKQLTAYLMKKEGHSLKQIADHVDCHKCQVSTLIREYKRNHPDAE